MKLVGFVQVSEFSKIWMSTSLVTSAFTGAPAEFSRSQPMPSTYCADSPGPSSIETSGTGLVPSVWKTATVLVMLADALKTATNLTLRTVLLPGAGTMSVLVAVVMLAVFVRPGVTVVPFRSTQEA